jgi:hypothetical protein
MFQSIIDILKPFVEVIKEPATSYGAVFGLIGFALQLMVRGEWPTGRLNDGSPTVVDPMTAASSVIAAVVIGIAAANFFQLDVAASQIDAYKAATPDILKGEGLTSFLGACNLSQEAKCIPHLQAPTSKAIILIAVAYLAADLIVLKKVQQVLQGLGSAMAAIPKKLRGAR